MSIAKLLHPVSFPEKNYYQTMQAKTQIVLHHTAGASAMSAINWWKTRNNGKGTIATPYVIERDGRVFQLFNAFQWAYHIGVSGKPQLDRKSIAIEIVSWGGLAAADVGTKVPEKEVIDYGPKGFRGFRYYQKYSPAQLESISLLLPILSTFASIPIKNTSFKNLFELSSDALAGKSGLYTHVSYRSDKSDCHPQKELVEMLAGL